MNVHEFGDPDRDHVAVDIDRRTAYLLFVALSNQADAPDDPAVGATVHEWEALAIIFEVLNKGLTATGATHPKAAWGSRLGRLSHARRLPYPVAVP